MKKKWLVAWAMAAMLAGVGTAVAQAEAGTAPPAPRARTRRAQPPDRGAMTEEQREARRQEHMQRMQDREALPEEERVAREAMRREQRRQWENMTDEERHQMRERMQQRRREQNSPREVRPQPGRRAEIGEAEARRDQAEVEQGMLREAIRDALQRRRQWVLERYDRDGDGMLSQEERAALRRDLQAHMQKFFQ